LPNSLEPDGQETGAVHRQAKKPYWLGIALVVIGAIWIYGSSSLSQTQQYAAIGPGLFVTIIGVVLVGLGLVLTFQIARQTISFDIEDAEATGPFDWGAIALAIVAVGLPILLMERLGFPITAGISFALVARAFGSRRILVDLVGGIILSAIAFYGFSKLGVSLGDTFPFLRR
jgi:putative tricarboxylic transport membrane protein